MKKKKKHTENDETIDFGKAVVIQHSNCLTSTATKSNGNIILADCTQWRINSTARFHKPLQHLLTSSALCVTKTPPEDTLQRRQ